MEYSEAIKENIHHRESALWDYPHYDSAGMIAVIATALATATGSLYPLFAPVIGCLGTFITGSDTSSNTFSESCKQVLQGKFMSARIGCPLQIQSGATGGKIISPQSIAIATSAGNQQGKEGEILKAAIPYALVYVAIAGIVVYIFSLTNQKVHKE